MSLEGFAEELANHAELRARILKTGSLIAWPAPKLVGVCSNPQCLRMNSVLLKKLADFWRPQWTAPAMIPIDEAKAEANGAKVVWGLMACI